MEGKASTSIREQVIFYYVQKLYCDAVNRYKHSTVGELDIYIPSSDVPMDYIIQIKREHITEPIKRSIELHGNRHQRLALILNMAIKELVLLISKMLEVAGTIRNKILNTDVTNAEKIDFTSNMVIDNTDLLF